MFNSLLAIHSLSSFAHKSLSNSSKADTISALFMKSALSCLEAALGEAKRALGANAKRPELSVDDVIDKNFVGVAR